MSLTDRLLQKSYNYPDYGKAHIQGDRRYNDADGWLGKVINGFEYLGNISRSAIDGLSEGKALKNATEAAMQQRYTDPKVLRNKIVPDADMGPGFDVGDVVDFVGDVTVDVVTDPLSYATLGLGGLVRSLGSKALKSTAKKGIRKGLLPTKIADKAADFVGPAEKIMDNQVVGRQIAESGIGAMYGVGTGTSEDSLGDKMLRGMVGAVSVPAVKKLGVPIAKRTLVGGKLEGNLANKLADKIDDFGTIPKKSKVADDLKSAMTADVVTKASGLGKILKGGDDAIGVFGRMTDSYVQRATKNLDPSLGVPHIKSMTKLVKTATDASKHIEKRTNEVLHARTDILKDMSENELLEILPLWEKMHNWQKLKRNQMWRAELKGNYKKYRVEANTKFGDSSDPKLVELGNRITRVVNNLSPAKVKQFQKEIGAEQAVKLEQIAESNRDIIQGVNKRRDEYYKRPKPSELGDPQVKDELGYVEGLDYYIPKIRKKADQLVEDLSSQPKGGFKAASDTRSSKLTKVDLLGFSTKNRQLGKSEQLDELKALWEIEARNMAMKDIMPEQMKALETLTNYNDLPGFFNKSLRALDSVTSFAKANMLFASMSWMVNNYNDNVMKAYIQHGLWNAFQVGTLGAMNKSIAKDVKAIVTGNLDKKFLSDIGDDLIKYGVVDRNTLQTLYDDKLAKFVYSESKIAEKEAAKLDRNAVVGLLEDAKDKYLYFLQRTTGQTGNYIESFGKAVTYDNTLKALKSDPLMRGKSLDYLKQKASDITIDTFFDYSTVDHFEKSVLKRLIPFFSFYKANSAYYLDVLTDPERLSRFARLQNTIDGVGEPLTEQDKLELPAYFEDKNARRVGTVNGSKRYAMVGNSSAYDFIKVTNLDGAIAAVEEKINPLIRSAVEMASGRDQFAESEYFPSDRPGKQAFLYSKGFSYYFGQELMDKIIGTDDLLSIKLDPKGNPVTESDVFFAFDRVMSTVIPFNILMGQVAGHAGKIGIKGTETFGGAVLNRISPVKISDVSPGQAKFNRLRKMKEQQGNR